MSESRLLDALPRHAVAREGTAKLSRRAVNGDYGRIGARAEGVAADREDVDHRADDVEFRRLQAALEEEGHRDDEREERAQDGADQAVELAEYRYRVRDDVCRDHGVVVAKCPKTPPLCRCWS